MKLRIMDIANNLMLMWLLFGRFTQRILKRRNLDQYTLRTYQNHVQIKMSILMID